MMCASLKLSANDDPRCPEVPNETRCATTPGAGRPVKYAVTNRDTSTGREGSTGFPANGLIFIGCSPLLSQVQSKLSHCRGFVARICCGGLLRGVVERREN